MLRPRTLVQTLSQVVTGGVRGTILMNRDGMLLAYAGFEDKNARIVSAIASSIWTTFEKQGQETLNGDGLTSFTIISDNATILVSKVANVLLVIHSATDVPLGVLKAKMSVLTGHLEEPLNLISTS